MNIFNLTNFFSLIASGNQAQNAVDPLYNAISLIGPYAMGVVIALGLIYGVIVGYRFAKAENTEQRAAMQKVLINGIIGFVTVFILIAILYAIRGPLTEWMGSN